MYRGCWGWGLCGGVEGVGSEWGNANLRLGRGKNEFQTVLTN
jgi:hypothetical protein